MADCKKTEKGQTIDIKDRDGNSPLLIASKGGHDEVVEMLLKLGSSVNVTNNSSETALHLASKEGHEGVVKYLLQAGADPNMEDISGTTPWHIAAAGGYASILSLFADKRETGNGEMKKTMEGFLHDAAQKGAINDVQALLEQGVPLNERNEKGETPLYIAAANGHEKIVKLLLDAGADQWLETETGSTAFHAAAKAGLGDVIKLLTNGSKEHKDLCSNTCKSEFKKSLTSDKTKTVDQEKECGKKNQRRLDIYHHKEKMDGSKKNIRLAKKWEDIYKKAEFMNFSDSDSEDVNLNEKKSHCSIIGDYLEALNSRDENEKNLEMMRIEVECYINNVSKIEDLDVNEDLGNGLTLLHIAAVCRAEETLKILLKRKANVHAKTEGGITPLMMAAFGGSLEIVKVFIETGAQPKEKDNLNRTPLHYAVQQNALSVIDYLLSIGLNPNAKDIKGNTALHYAGIFNRNAGTIFALLNAGADIRIQNNDSLIPGFFVTDAWLLSFLLPTGYSINNCLNPFIPHPNFLRKKYFLKI